MNYLVDTYHRIEIYFTAKRSRAWLWTIASLGLTASLLLSQTAWSTDRAFPLIPIIPGVTLPGFVQSTLFIITVASLLLSLFTTRFRTHLTSLAILSLFILVLLDITRLQPWVLHYGAILLLFSFWVPKKYITTPHLLDAARLIIGGIYFWSGLQKINVRFFTEIFPWFTEALWKPFGEAGASVALSIGLLVPLIEVLFAIGLFTKRGRLLSIIGATAMLLLVLLSIGPAGQEWNSSVWPWNLGIYSMVFVLFFSVRVSFGDFIKRQRHNVLAWFVLCIFWIMPAGNLFGITDHYLSWSLYSGRVSEAVLIGNQEALLTLSPTARDGRLTFQSWTVADINLVPYPEERVFLSVFESICADKTQKDTQLKIMTPRLFYSNIIEETLIDCSVYKSKVVP